MWAVSVHNSSLAQSYSSLYSYHPNVFCVKYFHVGGYLLAVIYADFIKGEVKCWQKMLHLGYPIISAGIYFTGGSVFTFQSIYHGQALFRRLLKPINEKKRLLHQWLHSIILMTMRWPFIIQKIHFRYWSMYSSCSFKIHSTLHPLYCKPFYQSLCSDIISRNSMLLLMYRLVYRLYIFDVLKTSVRLMKEWNGDSWQETGCGWCKKLISQVSLGIQQAFHFTILLTMKWPFIIQEIQVNVKKEPQRI